MTCVVTELHGERALASIAAAWSGLCDRSDATIFQRPEWLLPYAKTFVDRSVAIAVWAGDRLVGLLPLAVCMHGEGPTLQLLGTGLSDYLDAVVDPGERELVSGCLATALARTGVRWREVDFQQLPEDSVLLRMQAPAGAEASSEPHEPCPAVSLRGAADGAAAPAHMTRKVAYYARRAAARGEVSFETATEETCDALFDTLETLHARRWTMRGGAGVLANGCVRAFHHGVLHGLASHGLLAMHALRIDGHVAAVAYGFRDAQRAYYYIGGFDPVFAAVSPGTLIVSHAIDCARREGSQSFEFLRGREPYKYFWGARDRVTYRRRLRRA